MLKFVLGRACSGKSRYIVEAAAKESMNSKVMIIVPEQFSFETERAVLHTEKYNNDNISVTTFTKLYHEVSALTGFGRLPVMSDGERAIITDMAIKSCSDRLTVFSRFADYPDFCLEIADVIRDIKFADITADELNKVGNKLSGACGAKIRDIATILSAYDALIFEKYIDSSDYLTRLYNLLLDLDFFKDKKVFFDSFTGFTGQQYKIIKNIIEYSDETTFSFCTDDIKNEDISIFYNINESARKIVSIANELKVAVDTPLLLEKNFYSSDTLKHLEAMFAKDENCNEKNNGSLKIYSCSNPKEEVYAATSLIKHLVDKENYRYRDFIVVARNADDYKNYFEVFSKKNGIQCYYDKKVNLCDTFLYAYLNSLIQISLSYSTENILNFIKCGFNDFAENDIYALEDYIFVWGITGSDWSSEWQMHPKGLNETTFYPDDTETLSLINALREQVNSKLTTFRKAFFGDAKTRVEALYNFIKKENADKYLAKTCLKYEAENDRFSASALRQSWDAVMRVLNSITKLYSGEISSETFAKSFKISCKSVNLSNIPQMLDEVTFGSADRIRPSKPKVCIILGANQGVFPNNSSQGGILSRSDKLKIESINISEEGEKPKKLSFNDNEIKSSVEENYLVYSMCCCPVDKTVIFLSEKTFSGEKLEPSVFVTKICNYIDGTKLNKFNPFNEEFLPKTPASALYLLQDLIGDEFETIKSSLSDIDEYSDKLSTFDKSKFTDSKSVSEETADKLFKKDISISASNLDVYHNCKYKFLLQYGIYVKKLEKAEINKAKHGNILHYVFENMINTHKKGIVNLTEDEMKLEIDRLINEYLNKFVGSDILITARFKYLLSKISLAAKDVLNHLCDEFRQSGFEPMYCELDISKDGTIPPYVIPLKKGSVAVRGKIDRVDLYKDTIRVVDYKSNGKDFKLSETIYGLNLQMLLYLYILLKNQNGLFSSPKPAGILYMPGSRDEKNKGFRMNGLIIKDKEIIKAMEQDGKGKYIPTSRSTNSFVDNEMFDLIFENIENQIIDMGETIKSGELSPNPISFSKDYSSCKYCDYKTICRSSDENLRELKSMSHDDIKQYLKGGKQNGV